VTQKYVKNAFSARWEAHDAPSDLLVGWGGNTLHFTDSAPFGASILVPARPSLVPLRCFSAGYDPGVNTNGHFTHTQYVIPIPMSLFPFPLIAQSYSYVNSHSHAYIDVGGIMLSDESRKCVNTIFHKALGEISNTYNFDALENKDKL